MNDVAIKDTETKIALTPNADLLERLREVKENLETVEFVRIPEIELSGTGFKIGDREPVSEISGVIIHVRKTNIYYEKAYNPKEKAEKPDCFSTDGIWPDPSIDKPQNARCKGCPQAEFGTNSMKSGKACRNLRLVYMLMSQNAVLPRRLTVTPTSLGAIDNYLLDLTEQGYNFKKVKTTITAYKDDEKDTYSKLKFKQTGVLDEQQAVNVAAVREVSLSLMTDQKPEGVE